jgi:hypothetical protein
MALIDKISKYGPNNPIGQRGTGTVVDTLAYENGKGITGGKSLYGTVLPYGKRLTRYEDSIK